MCMLRVLFVNHGGRKRIFLFLPPPSNVKLLNKLIIYDIGLVLRIYMCFAYGIVVQSN